MASSILSRISNDLLLHQYHGAGNNFLIYDARKYNFPFVLIERLCEYYEVDGILLLCDSQIADYQMRIFNPDATEAEMCGNGLRCFIRYLEEHCKRQSHYRIETLSGILEAWHEGDEIGVHMPSPTILDWKFPIDFEGKSYEATYLKVGVPHLVFFLEQIDEIPLDAWGSAMQPLCEEGANVNFVQVHPDQSISIRTFERGVNRETMSCGTGSTASAIACAHRFGFPSPIRVHNTSNQSLTIRIEGEKVQMIGPAVKELSIKCPGQYNGLL